MKFKSIQTEDKLIPEAERFNGYARFRMVSFQVFSHRGTCFYRVIPFVPPMGMMMNDDDDDQGGGIMQPVYGAI